MDIHLRNKKKLRPIRTILARYGETPIGHVNMHNFVYIFI